MSKTTSFIVYALVFAGMDCLRGKEMLNEPTVMFLLGMAAAFINIHIGNTKP